MNTTSPAHKPLPRASHRSAATHFAALIPQKFTVRLANGLDAWLLITLTGWAGQNLAVSNYLPLEPTELRLTYRAGTIGARELRLLLDDVLQFREASQSLQVEETEGSETACEEIRNDVLADLARHAHLYLDGFDIVALVHDVHGFDMRTKMDVVGCRVPSPDASRAELVTHLRLCAACFRLTYLHEDGYRVASPSHQLPDEPKPVSQA